MSAGGNVMANGTAKTGTPTNSISISAAATNAAVRRLSRDRRLVSRSNPIAASTATPSAPSTMKRSGAPMKLNPGHQYT